MDILTMIGLGGLGGGIVASKLIDYFVPFESSPQGKLFKAQKEWQNELEEKRMNFQWEIEAQRMRFQERMEEKREELQKHLQANQIEASKAIALFQARAMRQTQMLLAQKHAQDTLQDHLLQDALRTFPLNVSPLVLLKNQSQPLGHLLAFSDKDEEFASKTSIAQVYEEVEAIRKRPDALNIFVAPVHIDSKIKNRKVLSDQIWDTVYQRIESFFIENYNRSGDHPVIFYPTAWNDKYNPGMHAAETLHYFLKDLPCVVIEPRFDGTTFRMVFSAWGIGYNSNVHHRTELSFPMNIDGIPINIDAVLASSVYERSLKALDAIKEIEQTLNINEYGFGMKKKELERNIDLFQALHIEERMKENRMEEIDALGIYNIFKIEPVQDLAKLAEYLSVRIGLNLAVLADIHHLRSYDRDPILPSLLKPYFPSLYEDKSVREQLFQEYENSYVWLRREEIEFNGMKEIRGIQIANIKKLLDLSNSSEVVESVTEMTCNYVKKHFNVDANSLTDAINFSIELWKKVDIPFFQSLLKVDEVADNRKLFRRIDAKIFDLQQAKG